MMHVKSVLLLLVILLPGALAATAQQADSIALKTPAGTLYGTLELPKHTKKKMPVVLIIPGSGPADRNGNGEHSINNSAEIPG